MPYETLLYEKRESIVLLTLHRPDRMNALNRVVWEELLDALDKIEQDSEVRVYLLTGAPRSDGRPVFSAGADLKAQAEGQHSPPWLAPEVVNRIDEMLKPSIAVIDGLCTTGGLELAMAFDLRVASDRAQLGDWHLKVTGLGIGA